jgi:hypothetical protein
MQLLLLAFDAALYPTLLAAVVILLAQERPVALLAAYLAGGMLVSVGLGLGIVLVLGGSSSLSSTSGVSWVGDVAVGGLALLLAVALASRADQRMMQRRKERKERKQREAPQPEHDEGKEREPWSQRLLAGGSVPLVFFAALAINLPGAAYLIALKDIAAGHHSTGADVALILLFNVIMFLLAEIPLLGLLFAPERTNALVQRANAWASGHGREIAIGLSLFLGLFLIVRGIAHS